MDDRRPHPDSAPTEPPAGATRAENTQRTQQPSPLTPPQRPAQSAPQYSAPQYSAPHTEAPRPENAPHAENAQQRPAQSKPVATALPAHQPSNRPVPPPKAKPESNFKRGFGLGAGTGLGFAAGMIILPLAAALILGLFSIIGGLASSLAGPKQTSVESHQTIWGEAGAKHKLRAIPISGAIMTDGASGGLGMSAGTYGYEVAQVLDKMDAKEADGVILMMDTPGGTVTGAKAISDAADRYRERTGKKVYAFIKGMSASGGMYAMAGVDEITADHGTLIGHVGVIMGPFSQYTNVTSSGSLLQGEVTAEKIESGYITAGKGKDVGNPYRPMTDDERKMLQGNVDRMYDDFVAHVSSKRDIPEATIREQLGAGLFDEKKAKEVKYIDSINNFDGAMRHFAEASGLDAGKTQVVQSTAPGGLASLFGAQLRPWGVAPAAQPIDGQPARPTTSICYDNTTPLMWSGSLASVCG